MSKKSNLDTKKTRTAGLKPERRSEIARTASQARWGSDDMPKAICGTADKPLKIGGIEMTCYVLDDGRRVFTQSGLQSALGLSTGGGKNGSRKLPVLLTGLATKGFEIADLADRADSPFLFVPEGGGTARGYEATFLVDICHAVLDARRAGLLTSHQSRMAEQCEILVKGFSRVGIIATVDEWTGYQEHRAKDALVTILESFVAKELRKWVKTFPIDFYREMFRLRGWTLDPKSSAKPGVVGRYTNNLIYSRLAPGVLDELQRLSPRDDNGNRKTKMFQWLTPDIGHPKLQDHLNIVIAFMKGNDTWADFIKQLDRVKPKFQLPPDEIVVDTDEPVQTLRLLQKN